MITDLRINNYALIRELELRPGAGLNIITGETGAGKSIIMGALGMLRGTRADLSGIRNAAGKSVVEAEFSLDGATAASLRPVLDAAGVPVDGDICLLRREISPGGRSRAFVNDSPVTLDVMRSVSDMLVDIHSQHKNLQLADPEFQLTVLDTIAGNEALVERYGHIYADYRAALKRFSDARNEIEETRRDADYLRYKLDELNAAALEEGEDAELEIRFAEMSDARDSAECWEKADAALSASDSGAADLVVAAAEALSSLGNDTVAADLAARLRAVEVELRDIADTVSARAGLEAASPESLAAVEDRIALLNGLKSKYSAADVNALIAIRDSLSGRLQRLADAEITLRDLELAARNLKKQALEAAAELSTRRSEAARYLTDRLLETASSLGLRNMAAEISLTTGKLNPRGTDTVEFLFRFNKNQPLQPIGATASGGEISRVMLVLKAILAGRIDLPTIIFDEIDTGVSGDVASRMGALMKRISADIQVIAITHLPAVAAYGDRHFKVSKHDTDEATETCISLLDEGERRAELALMLGGDPTDTAALAAADSLLLKSAETQTNDK